MLDALCSPAVFYLVCAIISLLIGINLQFDILSLLAKGFFIFIWTMFLNYLCESGHSSVSWLLVFLPFIFLALGGLAFISRLPRGHPLRRRANDVVYVTRREVRRPDMRPVMRPRSMY